MDGPGPGTEGRHEPDVVGGGVRWAGEDKAVVFADVVGDEGDLVLGRRRGRLAGRAGFEIGWMYVGGGWWGACRGMLAGCRAKVVLVRGWCRENCEGWLTWSLVMRACTRPV